MCTHADSTDPEQNPQEILSIRQWSGTLWTGQHCLVFLLFGEIDLLTAPRTTDTIGQALKQAEPSLVVIDLGSVSFLDSQGLAMLDHVTQVSARHDHRLRVAAAVGQQPRKLIELVGLAEHFALCSTLADALAT